MDGDIYTVIWDPALICDHEQPMNYNAAPPLQKTSILVTDITAFFCDFMQNNNLGQIANASVAISDISPLRIRDPRCVALAALHSTAVDFQKTGLAAAMPRELNPTEYPDFMEKGDKKSYESITV